MNRRLVLYTLPITILLNLCFFTEAWASDFYDWVGGPSGNWNVAANWENRSTNANELPTIDADVEIIGSVIVTILASDNITVESVYLQNGASLVIEDGGILNTRKGNNAGSEGFTLAGGSTLTLEGTLNVNDLDNALGVGLRIEAGNSATIESTGVLNIPDAGNVALAVDGDLTNKGEMLITNPADEGILVETGGDIMNSASGSITITGGTFCIKLRSSSSFTNKGNVTISGSSDKIIEIGTNGDFTNEKILNGDGEIRSNSLFTHVSGSTLSPGTENSPGKLILRNGGTNVNLSGVNLAIEIDGTSSSDYDQIELDGSGDLNLDGAILNLSGTHTPSSGEQFSIFTAGSGDIVPGDFDDMSYSLNGRVLNFMSGGNLADGGAFPVELTSFIAKPANKTVQLHWTTATETNNDYFSIEHSTDGRYFQEVGKVTGAGTTQAPQDYAFIHSSPAAGLNYYRLNQYDFDGAQAYSPVQTVEIDGKNTWAAWPILAHDRINLDWAEAPPANTIIEAYNLAGQKVYSQPVPEGAIQVQIPVQQWASGWHSIVVQQNGAVSSQRVIKE